MPPRKKRLSTRRPPIRGRRRPRGRGRKRGAGIGKALGLTALAVATPFVLGTGAVLLDRAQRKKRRERERQFRKGGALRGRGRGRGRGRPRGGLRLRPSTRRLSRGGSVFNTRKPHPATRALMKKKGGGFKKTAGAILLGLAALGAAGVAGESGIKAVLGAAPLVAGGAALIAADRKKGGKLRRMRLKPLRRGRPRRR